MGYHPEMRTIHGGLVPLLLLFLAVGSASGAELFVQGGWLFDATGDSRVRYHGIHIVNGRLHAVHLTPTRRLPADIPRLQLGDDETILPGLIDLHAHYNMTLHEKRREETVAMPVIYLANGVTTTFPAGSFDPHAMLEMRRRIDRGEQVGPRVLNSGPYFGPARPGWDAQATPAQIEDEIDRWVEAGVAGFKVKRISAAHLRVVIERAHRHGLTVTGHLDSGFRDTVNPRDAIRMGIDRVEHFLGGDAMPADKPAYDSFGDVRIGTPEFKRIVDLFVEHRVFFDATLTGYGYFGDREAGFDHWTDERRFLTPYARRLTEGRRQRIERFGKIYEIKLETVKAFYDAGGAELITLGTDHNSSGEYLPGFSAHRELQAMVLAGIPPAAALRIGTINGARAMNLGEKLGTIEPGKWADLFVVRGNPLEQITATRNVRIVLLGGVVHHPEELLGSVEDSIGPKNEQELAAW